MAIGRTAGYPDLGSGSNNKYIKQLYLRKMLRNYYKTDVVPKITNSDVENQTEIKKIGDKAIFRKKAAVSVNNYVKGMELSYQTPTEDALELEIDKALYWGFEFDDIDLFQSDLDLQNEYSMEAAEQMKTTICTNFLADIFDDVATANQGASAGVISGNINMGVSGAPFIVTRDNVLYWFNNMQQVLDEQDAPKENRHITLPPAGINLVMSSDLKSAMFAGTDKSVLLNGGTIGTISGFDIHETNCVNSQTDGGGKLAFDIFANNIEAVTFCAQITKTQTIDQLPNSFTGAVRGLSVYGYKMVQNQVGLWSYANFSLGA